MRLFKAIFREVKVFDYKCEAFIKITRLFEYILENGGFNYKSEPNSKIMRLFENILELRIFLKNPRLF
jgi:hypothetical protein